MEGGRKGWPHMPCPNVFRHEQAAKKALKAKREALVRERKTTDGWPVNRI